MDNVKSLKTANLDQYQMDNMSFDVEKQARRVTVVDGIQLNVDSITMPEMKFPEQQVIKVPEIIRESQVHQVNVPVIIKETQVIEVPKIITEYKMIEVPVVIREVQVVEIEKPVIVTEVKVIEKLIPTMPKSAIACMYIQLAVNIALLIMFFLKGR